MLVYDIYSKEQPLVISREAVRIAIEQNPEMEKDILSVIRKGIVKVVED